MAKKGVNPFAKGGMKAPPFGAKADAAQDAKMMAAAKKKKAKKK